MSACRACGAPIRWAKTVKGKTIPLDLEPNAEGNVTLDTANVATVHGKGDDLSGHRFIYMPHHATCPNWRK